jgi:hypothetical protein
VLAEECAHSLQRNLPERTPQQLIALPPMHIAQKLIEVAGRRLFEAFQAEQSAELFVGHREAAVRLNETR